MTEDRENQLTRLFSTVLAGAFFPTRCVLDESTTTPEELESLENETTEEAEEA
jgi:hypothetical protein